MDYATAFDHSSRVRSANEPEWLARARAGAFEAFVSRGFPTTRDEEWRFTSVAPIAGIAFVLGSAEARGSDVFADGHRLGNVACAELVFVNGRYAAALSNVRDLPAGVRVEGLASALANGDRVESALTRLAPRDQPFVALNTAFLEDAAIVRVAAGTIVSAPIHLLFISNSEDGVATMSHPRVLVVLERDSQATIVETYAGPAGTRYFTNAVTELVAGEHAVVDHYKRQYESAAGYHVGAMHVRAHRSANVSASSISLGGALVRNDVVALLDGEGAECTLDGLYVADGERLVDNHTTIDHAQPHCASREMYKGILSDRARGVFNGKVIVRPDAQKTDAKQTNRALLLSEDAQINTKPQLEIFANDVKCTHGAAVGQLDDEAVFYLRSRGIGQAEARRLLVRAFAGEVLGRMRLEPVRSQVESVLLRQLEYGVHDVASAFRRT